MQQTEANMKNYNDLTPRERRDVRAAVVSDFVGLLSIREQDNVYWVGTKVDLVELAYMAYEDAAVRDAAGLPVSFKQLVRRACACLHVVMPYSVYRLNELARSRKGIRSLPVVQRYYYLSQARGLQHPVATDLERIGPSPALPDGEGEAGGCRRL